MPEHESILIAQPVDDDGLRAVRGSTPGVVDVRQPIGPGEVIPEEQLRGRTVLFTDHPPANVDAMTSLRWIQLGSAGFQQLASAPVPDGVRVTNASGVNDNPIAEWCLLMMLASVRRLPNALRDQAAARFNRDRHYQAELRGRRVGIFGYGNIGRQVARLSRAFGLEVWAMSRSGYRPRPDRYEPGAADVLSSAPDREFGLGDVTEFLSGLDFLVLAAPLSEHTRGFFGAAELALLPPHAVLVNPARAHLVDETSLLDALRAGVIAGAALDVHYREPMPADDPFWTAPNVIVTPHVSGSTGSTNFTERVWELFALNLERHLAGKALLNEVPAAEWRAT